jgi:superfamily II DNA or RNA helicase
MTRLEDIKKGTILKGILPETSVTVVDVKWHGSDIVELTYKDASGRPDNQLLYRSDESRIEVITPGRLWSFDCDGNLLKLASEAYRINLAYLFDPRLAIHTSVVEPLPHQITAVYGEMLPRQPLRYLLADDPGAGKTIMAGLLIKELLIRGDLTRCLICCPGILVDQWQDELWKRFQLKFDIISNQTIEDSKSGNPYVEKNLVISRLDHMSRNEEIQAKLAHAEWDLVVVDEAHKMAAHYFGNEIKETKRYKLGKILGAADKTRHLLLLTATPHSGKEEDFQLFLALLDNDRFEGKFRDGVHTIDTSDIMRRLVKEKMVKFDGTPLFPERRAYTVTYKLSDIEAALYVKVTDYVRKEMNRADRLKDEGDGRRGNRVGFALTILQRRLASSPEAIYRSLVRRRERLEKRLREEKIYKRGSEILEELPDLNKLVIDEEEMDDLGDAPESEVTEIEDKVVEQASAARTIAELEAEISTLLDLEGLAQKVRASDFNKKWEELSNLLQNNDEMFDSQGKRRKLIIFTEHRDTLNYLNDKIKSLIGTPESVITIHGGMGREDRRKAQELFTFEPNVQILVATDAAGEGINLQRAHLMMNYDLPWNPNRLEQRFGRIHRIGQTEVCHMWSLVANETREGEVFHRLLTKIETERNALGGGVFDVLGRVFEGTSLRELLIEAIRYGEQPEIRTRLTQKVEIAMDREHIRKLLEERALVHDSLDIEKICSIREELERAAARKLQPHFIRSFFIEALKHLGGSISEREPKRYEITHVPSVIRSRDRQIGIGEPILNRYERACFDKNLITLSGKPLAAFICPGHPLLNATIDLVLERHRDVLKRGALLVDTKDESEEMRALFYLEHALQEGRLNRDGSRRIASKRMMFVEINGKGETTTAGYAPYLDYRPITDNERLLAQSVLEANWLSKELEPAILEHAAIQVIPKHLEEIRSYKLEYIAKVTAAVKERLSKEINYWDHRANELKAQELAGKVNAKMNSGKARQRADDLESRMKKRLNDLDLEKHITPLPPNIIGGAIVVPIGLIKRLKGDRKIEPALFARETKRVELVALKAVLENERKLGFRPRDVSKDKCGYDVESQILTEGNKGKLRFIEVKGRIKGADTVTISKNEILTALNKPEDFILALVVVPPVEADEKELIIENIKIPEGTEIYYVWKPFLKEPDFGVTSVNYELTELMRRGEIAL